MLPLFPVITTEHEYGSPGLGGRIVKEKKDPICAPGDNVTVDKLRIAFDSDENPFAGKD